MLVNSKLEENTSTNILQKPKRSAADGLKKEEEIANRGAPFRLQQHHLLKIPMSQPSSGDGNET
jgi:hypothetical protein